MFRAKRRWLFAISVALYLYFGLPATAQMFYELYHLTHIDSIYWGYSGFKAAGYYFGIWAYKPLTCVLVAVVILLLPALVTKLRGA